MDARVGDAPAASESDPQPQLENEQIAAWLRQAAEILQAQGANPFRVSAYRKAADTVGRCPRSLRDLLAQSGVAGLDALPGIGAGIAAAIAEMLQTGHWTQLERLRGSLDPVSLFRTVPGVGPELAQRIHDALDVDTLEALETASHDGRLQSVPGVGKRRGSMIRAALAEILDRSRLRRRAPLAIQDVEPSVELLLDVDREYRRESRERDRLALLRLGASTPRAGHGYQYFTRHGANGTSRPCSRIRPGPIS